MSAVLSISDSAQEVDSLRAIFLVGIAGVFTSFESGSSSSRMVAMCSELIAPRPLHMIPFLVLTGGGAVLGQAFDQPGRPGTGAGLNADVREDLVGPFVGHGLGLQEGGDLGLERVTVGFLEEENAVGEILVVSTDLGVDALVGAEVALGCEDHGHQRELGLVDRNMIAAEGFDQAAIQVFEQPAAILGERGGGLVKDQIMIGFQELIIGERAFVEKRPATGRP